MSERALTAAFKAAIAESVVRPALLMYADFPSGEVRCWTGYGTLSWDGHEWAGTGNLIKISPVTETQDSASNDIEAEISGLDAALLGDVLNDEFQGRDCRLWLMLLNSAGAVIADPYEIFRGYLDGDDIQDDGGTCTLRLRAANRLSDQLTARTYHYTPEDQKILWPASGDTGLRFINALQDKKLPWRETEKESSD